MHIAPCKDCKDRNVSASYNCHTDCTKYLKWFKLNQEAEKFERDKRYFDLPTICFKRRS